MASQLERILRRDRERAVRAAVAAFTRELDRYGTFPREVLDGDISRIVRQNIELFFTALATGRLPAPDELDVVSASAAARAEERVPLHLVVGAYLIGARATLETVYADESLGGVMPAPTVAFVLDYLTVATSAAIGGYLEESRVIAQAAQSVRERLLDSLLSGGPLTDSFGYDLPDRFLVLAVMVGPSSDERRRDVDRAMAAHRKLRRLRAALDELCGDRHLTAIGADGGLILIPVNGPDATALVNALAEAADAEILAGTAAEVPTRVADAARLATEVLEVVRILRRPPGVYAVDDVVVEYQISRPGPACDALAARLAPLEGNADLLDTLRSFLDTGGNRRRAARALGVHANTVDNRMRRVAELTDTDLANPDDRTRLHTAIVARDALRHRSNQ